MTKSIIWFNEGDCSVIRVMQFAVIAKVIESEIDGRVFVLGVINLWDQHLKTD